MTQEETVDDKIGEFHAHLDICVRCRNNPFGLCGVGAILLKTAAGAANTNMQQPADTEQATRSEIAKMIYRRVYNKED